MSAQTVWTIKELLNWTTTYLKAKGVESPRLEAQILLAHVMSVPKIEPKNAPRSAINSSTDKRAAASYSLTFIQAL